MTRALTILLLLVSFLVGVGLIFGAWLLIGPSGSTPTPSEMASTPSAPESSALLTGVLPSSALPREGDLTMGGEAGEVLIGLTVRPGQPGRNEVLVYVLPLEGEGESAGIPVGVSSGGRFTPATECGPTCRKAEVALQGGERLLVRVGGRSGGEDRFELPELPADDASVLYARMQERMHELDTYRVEETLSSGQAVVRARYAFQAPDRMRISIDSGSDRVIVGNREWSRERTGESWEEEPGIKRKVPRFIWDVSGRPVAPRILGRGQAGGAPATVISFFGQSGSSPIWYRLWMDSQGLVRRAEMRAPGHFMDHRYFAFDAPFEIVPPKSRSADTINGNE